MKALRLLVWIAALLPALAAACWASFASHWPEPWRDRQALLEVTPRWSFQEWADFGEEPMHVVTRVLHLGALHVPGATVASIAWVNALLALLVAVALGELVRRTFSLAGFAAPIALAVAGLLVCSPAHGANWVFADRLGVFLPPLFLLWAASCLQREGRFPWRAFAVLVLVGLAPFCHTHGVLLTFAVLPVLAAGARRAGSTKSAAWIGACLVVGNVAAVFSLRTSRSLVAADAGFHASFTDWLVRTGSAWPNVLPGSTIDECVLGALTWLLPLLVWWAGDRSPEARLRAAPWWSCFCFGLLVVVLDGLRYDVAPPVGTWREAMFGAFLLPVGVIGVLAARFGQNALFFLGGAVAALAAQDWYDGLEALRQARMRAATTEARMALPASLQPAGEAVSPLRADGDLATLRERALVPAADASVAGTLVDVFAGGPSTLGECHGGDAQVLRGTVRSSLRHDTVQTLFVVAKPPSPALLGPRIVGTGAAPFARFGRNVPFELRVSEKLQEGERVRVLGYLPGQRRLIALGPTFVVHGTTLRPEAGRP